MNTTDSATPQARTQDVVVKPLEWTETLDWFDADIYSIRPAYGQGPAKFMLVRGDKIIRWHDELEYLKGWATEDHNATIYNAIEVRRWRPMAEAPAGDVSAVIDIWDGERRVPDCFWSDTDQCWLFEDWDGAHYTNVAVTDPQAWMWVPKAPEGL